MNLKNGDILTAKIDYIDESNCFIKGRKYIINTIIGDTAFISLVSDDRDEIYGIYGLDDRDFGINDGIGKDNFYLLSNFVYNLSNVKRIAKDVYKAIQHRNY